jgi:hypothetical protein
MIMVASFPGTKALINKEDDSQFPAPLSMIGLAGGLKFFTNLARDSACHARSSFAL